MADVMISSNSRPARPAGIIRETKEEKGRRLLPEVKEGLQGVQALFQGNACPDSPFCAASFWMRCAIMLSTFLDKAGRASRLVQPLQPAEDWSVSID